jgi:ethanolamine permease
MAMTMTLPNAKNTGDRLRRYAGVWSIWALGVGAVISGHFSGWNYGLAVAGWGGFLVAAGIMAVMYLCLVFCIAEMTSAIPSSSGSYAFASDALGPWGAYVMGLCDMVEYVLTPAVICFFIGSYLGEMIGLDIPGWLYWIATYGLFLSLNISGVAFSFRVMVMMTVMSLLILLFFCAVAFPTADVGRWALNIGMGGVLLSEGNGPLLPFGLAGIGAALPFAVWLYLAIEETPLAADETIDPRRDMPRGILLALVTLVVTAFLIVAINPAIPGTGSFALSTSGEPVLDGIRALWGDSGALLLGAVALSGLAASFHAILFGLGRQIFSFAESGFFPACFSHVHGKYRTPHVALLAGALTGLAIMLVLWFAFGGKSASHLIGSSLLNMAVFGALLAYVLRGLAYLRLKQRGRDLIRPFESPFGSAGAIIVVVIASAAILSQLYHAGFTNSVVWVAAWLGVMIAGKAFVDRRKGSKLSIGIEHWL